jgi:hypothetical protein
MTAWTPANLGANLLGWFDGADSATVTVSGAGVSQWTNKGVPGFTLTQGQDAYKPTYSASAVVFADNSNQYLAAGSPPIAYDVLIVGAPDTYNDWRTLLLSVSGSTTENTLLIQNTGGIGIYNNNFYQAGGLTWANAAQGLCYAQFSNAGPVFMSRDGGALASTGIAQMGIPLEGVGSSGSFATHSYTQAFGAVYELVFVPYNSSTDTRQRLEGYCAWKWGLQGLLPSGHPYKAAAPTVPATQDLAGDLSISVALSAFLAEDETIVGDLAPSVAFSSDLSVTPATALQGDFAPQVTFAGDLTFSRDLIGDLAPAVALAATTLFADETIVGDLAPSVAFAADLTSGPTSKYGKGAYGQGPYSAYGGPVTQDYSGNLAPSVVFAATTLNLDLQLAGDLAPQVALPGAPVGIDATLTGDLTTAVALQGVLSAFENEVGDLAPAVAFTATLGGDWVIAADLAPSVAFAGDLDIKGSVDLNGNLAPSVALAGTYLNSTYAVGGDVQPQAFLGGDLTFFQSLVADLAPQVTLSGSGLNIDAGVAGDLAPSVVFQGTLSAYEDEGGDLRPTVTLAATLNVDWLLAGNLTPSVELDAGLQGVLDAAANLAPQVALSATLGGDWALVGDMAATVALHGSLNGDWALDGDLASSVEFSGTLSAFENEVGDLAPEVVFGGDLVIDLALEGDLAPTMELSLDSSLESEGGSSAALVIGI